jgi:hypothetical protein
MTTGRINQIAFQERNERVQNKTAHVVRPKGNPYRTPKVNGDRQTFRGSQARVVAHREYRLADLIHGCFVHVMNCTLATAFLWFTNICCRCESPDVSPGVVRGVDQSVKTETAKRFLGEERLNTFGLWPVCRFQRHCATRKQSVARQKPQKRADVSILPRSPQRAAGSTSLRCFRGRGTLGLEAEACTVS